MKSMASQTSPGPFPLDRAQSETELSFGQGRFTLMIAAGLLMIGVVVAAACLSSFTPHWGELVKIVAVVMFVGSMVALALGMVGDSFRRR